MPRISQLKRILKGAMKIDKYYIFLVPGIVGIGGAQIYIRNKAKYLEGEGWSIRVLSARQGELSIEDLVAYSKCIDPLFRAAPMLLRADLREKLIQKCVIDIPSGARVVVESTSHFMSYWGEYLAERLHGQHLMLLCEERYKYLTDSEYGFFNFKFRRNELRTISVNTMQNLFRGHNKIKESECRTFTAFCTNSIEDIGFSGLSEVKSIEADYRIGSIGRLDKKYVKNMIEGIELFANKHPDIRIHFTIIGSSRSGSDSQLLRRLSRVDNMFIYHIQQLYPVPKLLVSTWDAAIASSGSAKAIALAGVPTIGMSFIDGEALGVMGYEIDKTGVNSADEGFSVDSLLEKILIQGEYSNKPYLKPLHNRDATKIFDLHLSYVDNANTESEYYDLSQVIPNHERVIVSILANLGADLNLLDRFGWRGLSKRLYSQRSRRHR